MLYLKTRIQYYDEVKSFFDEYEIGSGDLILTQEFIYKPSIYPLGEKADILYYENFAQGEPSNHAVDKMLSQVNSKNYKRIIAIGGGSVIDVAKLMVFEGTATTLQMFDGEVELKKSRDLIVVPTTCGTGSEVTNISIVSLIERDTKKGLALDEMYADAAVLIPELLRSLPYKFFLFSAADALIHAVESYLSPRATECTELFSVEAMKMIVNGFDSLLKNGEEERFNLLKEFLLASNYAGVSFGNAGVGAVHALSYPLGSKFHIAHGESNYRCFAAVMKTYDNKMPEGKIKNLKMILKECLNCQDDVFDVLDNMLEKLIGKKSLSEYGMVESETFEFAESVIKNQQRLLANNYVEISEAEIQNIYKNLL